VTKDICYGWLALMLCFSRGSKWRYGLENRSSTEKIAVDLWFLAAFLKNEKGIDMALPK
jgi:hypothetical protein